MFYRTFDPVDADGGILRADDGGATALGDQATISSLRVDKYEVTVGRFRQFNSAWDGGAGYVPPEGSGKHTHLNGGLGLANSGSPGSYEAGWSSADNGKITDGPVTLGNTGCNTTPTWTPTPGNNETLPMNCVSWYEAYAFCIWDGGFLPSEAEWGYVAAGGGEQREYPWGTTPPGTSNQFAICGDGTATCYYPTAGPCAMGVAPVGTPPLGAGRWGHFDLAGNLTEWTLDVGANVDPMSLDWQDSKYANPCVDCAYLSSGPVRTFRGGAFYSDEAELVSSVRSGNVPTLRNFAVGFRCARTP